MLHDVIDTRYNNDGFLTNQQRVKSISIGLPLGETASQFVSQVTTIPWTMSSKSLRTQVNALQSQGIGGTAMGNLQINLADKLAWPFACFVSVLIALPLALRFGKRGRTLGIALAIIAFFAYYLMTSAFFGLRPQRRAQPLRRRVAAQRHHGGQRHDLVVVGRALTDEGFPLHRVVIAALAVSSAYVRRRTAAAGRTRPRVATPKSR